MVTVDSYSEENYNWYTNLRDFHPTSMSAYSASGQSFTCGSTLKITSVKFYMRKLGSPLGNGHAVLYAHSGTYGTSSVPTGDPLATSDDFDVSDLTTDFVLRTLTFTGEEQYEMQADTKYCIVFESPATGTIDDSNYVRTGKDTSSPTHDGNFIGFVSSNWLYIGTEDMLFYVISEVGGVEHTHSASDTLAISDSLVAAMTFNVALDDTMSISDALAVVAEYKVALADRLNMSDALAVAATYNVAVSDVMAISDALTAAATYNVALADTLEISDELAYQLVVAILKKRGQIYGLKPARIAKVGRVGV